MQDNNKNIFVVLSIITIVLVAGFVLYGKYTGKVENFSDVSIITSLNQELLNYRKNTMPFTIKKNNKDCKVYVNGTEYNKGERIYKPGTYTIKVISNNKKETSTVNINEVQKEEKNTYRIYLLAEILQVLIGDLDLSKNPNQNAFLWTAKASTIDLEKVKKNMPNVQLSEYNGNTIPKSTEFYNTVIEEVKNYINTAITENQNSCFELYIHEEDFFQELELFGKLGLDDSRYNIIMYTDGTKGYVQTHDIAKYNAYETYCESKEKYFNIVESVKKNVLVDSDDLGIYIKNGEYKFVYGSLNHDYMLISTLRDNIELLLQFPEARKYNDEKVKEELSKANIHKFSMKDKFNELTEEQKQIFFDNINLDKIELDQKYFIEPSKEYLIITGTVPFYGLKNSKEEFEDIIKRVVNDYKNDYVILYKPHPRAIPTEEQEDFLNELGIKVLPGKIPMEAISFVYPNLKLGGFVSSLYMNVDEGKTLFFFAKDKEELLSPINTLYDILFYDAKFYN